MLNVEIFLAEKLSGTRLFGLFHTIHTPYNDYSYQ